MQCTALCAVLFFGNSKVFGRCGNSTRSQALLPALLLVEQQDCLGYRSARRASTAGVPTRKGEKKCGRFLQFQLCGQRDNSAVCRGWQLQKFGHVPPVGSGRGALRNCVPSSVRSDDTEFSACNHDALDESVTCNCNGALTTHVSLLLACTESSMPKTPNYRKAGPPHH